MTACSSCEANDMDFASTIVTDGKGRAMKIGLDSYCYHRFLGENDTGLATDPWTRLAIIDVIDQAKNAGAPGSAIENSMLPDSADGLSILLENCLELDAVLGDGVAYLFGFAFDMTPTVRVCT